MENGLIKIIITLVLIYFAYDYYTKNISTTGKALNEQNKVDNTKAINDLANKLKSDQNNVDQAECNGRYMAGVYEWTDVDACKNLKKALLNQTDWIALAKGKLGLN